METQKLIGWGIVIFIGYHVIKDLIPLIGIGLFFLILWRAYNDSQKPPNR